MFYTPFKNGVKKRKCIFFLQIIIITPKGVQQGPYSRGIESYYKNASISIGGLKVVIRIHLLITFEASERKC